MNQPDIKSKVRRRYAALGLLVLAGLLFAYYMGDQAGSVAFSASFTIDTRDADTEVRGASLLAAKNSAYFTIDTLDPDSVTQARSLASGEASAFFTINTLDPDAVVFVVSQTSSKWSGFFTIDTMADSSTRAESGYFTIDTMDPDALTRGVSLSASEESGWFTIDTLDPPPAVITQPLKQQVNEGGTVTLTVVAGGTAPLSYQWKKGNVALTDGGRVSGATTATLTITGALPADSGTYSVVVTDAVSSATSTGIVVGVVATGTSAAHTVAGGYIAGGTVTITNTISYMGILTGLTWHVLLPDNWSYASSAGAAGETKPAVGATSVLDWTWATVPASPVTFTYTLNVPAGTTGSQTLTSLATLTQNGVGLDLLAQPDPLSVAPMIAHCADTDRNFRISLLELTRVIELYNTRNGTIRTGAYVVQAGTEDDFAPDPARASGAVVTLASYHSADSDRNGKVSLLELTRVIELYNYRSGTTRTGLYHAQAGTEDGFGSGP